MPAHVHGRKSSPAHPQIVAPRVGDLKLSSVSDPSQPEAVRKLPSFHRGWFWLAGGPPFVQQMLHDQLRQYGAVRLGSVDEARGAMASDPERWAGLIALDAVNDAVDLAIFRKELPSALVLALPRLPFDVASVGHREREHLLTHEQRLAVTAFARRSTQASLADSSATLRPGQLSCMRKPGQVPKSSSGTSLSTLGLRMWRVASLRRTRPLRTSSSSAASMVIMPIPREACITLAA